MTINTSVAGRLRSSLLLLPHLPQQELGIHWRRRLRLLKLIGALLLWMLPAIISFLHLQMIEFGRARVLTLILAVLSLPLLLAAVVTTRRAVKNHRYARRDSDAARTIQQLILPQTIPPCRGFGLAATCHTFREVGGDFYDVIPAGPDRTLIVLADVSGKGVPAALVTCGIHAIVRTHAFDTDINAVAKLLGEYLLAHTGRYATLVLGVLHFDQRTFEFINAGHNPPLLLRENGEVERLDSVGPPVGLFPEMPYQPQLLELRGGDRLFFYTDGLTDRANRAGDNFGEEGVIAAARKSQHATPAHMTEMILAESERFAQGVPPDDDVTILVLKCYAKN